MIKPFSYLDQLLLRSRVSGQPSASLQSLQQCVHHSHNSHSSGLSNPASLLEPEYKLIELQKCYYLTFSPIPPVCFNFHYSVVIAVCPMLACQY